LLGILGIVFVGRKNAQQGACLFLSMPCDFLPLAHERLPSATCSRIVEEKLCFLLSERYWYLMLTVYYWSKFFRSVQTFRKWSSFRNSGKACGVFERVPDLRCTY